MKNIPFTESELREIRNHFVQELEKLEKQSEEIRNMLKKFNPAGKVEASEDIQANVTTAESAKPKRGRGRKKAEVVKTTESAIEAVLAEVKPEAGENTRKGKRTSVKSSGKANKSSSVKEVESSAKAMTKKTRVSGKKDKGQPSDSKKGTTTRKSNWAGFILDLLESNNQLLPSKAFVDAAMKRDKLTTSEDFIKTRGLLATKLSDMVNKSKTLRSYAQNGKKGSLYGLPAWFDENGNLVDAAKLVS